MQRLSLCFLLALCAPGCRPQCSDTNVDVSSTTTLDATTPTLHRVFEITLTPAAYASAHDVALYRESIVSIDVQETGATGAELAAPMGTFDVLVSARFREIAGSDEAYRTDVREGILVYRHPLFADCPATGPCTRTLELDVTLQEVGVGITFDWRLHTIGASGAYECNGDPAVVVRDVT